MDLYTTILTVHATAGSVALITGINKLVSKKQTTFQKTFLITSLIAALAGLALISYLKEDALKSVFFVLVICWLFTTSMLCMQIKKNNQKKSHEWFLRAFAFPLFFITMRLWRILLIQTGLDYQTAYIGASWLGLIGNLIVAEIIQKKTTHFSVVSLS